MSKGLKYDRHARRRMKWRKISEQEVEATLREPDKLESTAAGRMNAFKQLGSRYIKVTYKKFSDEILVISAVDKSD